MYNRKPKILCVDDEAANLKLLDLLLHEQGYEVICAADGQEALQKLDRHPVDLVLLDVMMPRGSGFDVCRKIKAGEATRNIPVVMLITPGSGDDRMHCIEAGADDFIAKPFDKNEVLARVKMLFKAKSFGDSLRLSYNSINDLSLFGEKIMEDFNPISYDFVSNIDKIVDQIISHKSNEKGKPAIVIAQFEDDYGDLRWMRYEYLAGQFMRFDIKKGFLTDRYLDLRGNKRVIYFNSPDDHMDTETGQFIQEFRSIGIKVKNILWYAGSSICIFALNYGRANSEYDCAVIKSLIVQSHFMRSLSSQIRETENAFEYMVYSLARAAEANDEGTGNHILRVGEYSAILARTLGLPDTFVRKIKIEATLHDVGKIHMHPDLLTKVGKLTDEEFDSIKEHTVTGAKIIGEHPRLFFAKNISISHHERWDGSGYPYRLKGEQIPIEARIVALADQYDALRSARSYKPVFDHEKSFRIITEGDGRTMPQHFDPQVLKAYIESASLFEKACERLKDK